VKGSTGTVGTRHCIDICTVGNEEAYDSLRGVGELVGVGLWIALWGMYFGCSEQGFEAEAFGWSTVCQEELNHLRVCPELTRNSGVS
jgi:hypothetical protein